jgi:uncharacterized membrane protein YbhN (UPF0104 family)
MPTETLQQKSSNNKNGKFLSNKKILIIVFAFLVMIGLVVVSVTSILHEFSFSKLLSDVHDAFVDSKTRLMASIMLCLLILFFFFKFFNMTVPYMIRLKHLGIKVSSKDATLYYLTSLFFSAISPSILITEPYTMF